jgi:hypothetical protein
VDLYVTPVHAFMFVVESRYYSGMGVSNSVRIPDEGVPRAAPHPSAPGRLRVSELTEVRDRGSGLKSIHVQQAACVDDLRSATESANLVESRDSPNTI